MNNPTAGGQIAPSTRETVRKGGVMGFTTRVYPHVYGGLCEKCGVIDPNQESTVQYKLCEHFRGLSLECNYCEPTKDQNETTRVSNLYVYDHPTMKDQHGRPSLGVVCNAFTCTNAFNLEYGK